MIEVLEKGNTNELNCTKCNSKLRWNIEDLNWTHNEPDYYYIVCPVCGQINWIKSTEELNQKWYEAMNPRYNLYNI